MNLFLKLERTADNIIVTYSPSIIILPVRHIFLLIFVEKYYNQEITVLTFLSKGNLIYLFFNFGFVCVTFIRQKVTIDECTKTSRSRCLDDTVPIRDVVDMSQTKDIRHSISFL